MSEPEDALSGVPSTFSGLESPSSITLPSFMEGTNPDFVLVWSEIGRGSSQPDAFKVRALFEQNLADEGLILESQVFDSVPHLHVLNIWAPLELLKRYSEILKVRLPMLPVPEEHTCQLEENFDDHDHDHRKNNARNSSSWGILSWWNYFIKFLSLEVDPNLFPEKSRGLTGVYSRDKEYLFDVHESNMYEVFPISLRTRIVHYILRRTPFKRGDELKRDDFAFGYERLLQKNVYEAAYPLHDGKLTTKGSMRERLYNNWGKLTKCFKYQPLDAVREYFGVNIAIYYAWLGYYTGMLVFASFFGLLCFIYGIVSIPTDQFVKDVCSPTQEIVMCPNCNSRCPYWRLSAKCEFVKFSHLFDNDFTVPFALLMSVWSAFFLEFWKRYSAKITHRWDLTNFDVRDFTPRPEYVAALKQIYPHTHNLNRTSATQRHRPSRGYRDGGDEASNKEKYDFELTIPFWKKELPFKLLSYSTVLLLVVLALSALTGVVMYRLWFLYWVSEGRDTGPKDSIALERITVSVTAALLNLTFIMVFERIYQKIAVKLTSMELPRTRADFESSYTLKIYLLQFINNYSSIFYVAFLKGINVGHPQKYNKVFGRFRQEECGITCMPELSIQLIVIMVGKQTKTILSEAVIPWCKRRVKRVTGRVKMYFAYKKEKSRPSTRRTSQRSTVIPQWLEDYDLLEWGPFLLTNEHLQMVLQFGFVTIFVTAFPLAPIFALINNLMGIRGDAGKILRHYRRPIGRRVKDIGVWSNIIDGVVKLAILSNACIIALRSNFIPKLMYRYVHFDLGDPDYGTLNGYLSYSLTSYNTRDLESPPSRSVAPVNEPVCHFHTYRYSHNTPDPQDKYQYRTDHWKIWLARVIFIIVYQNIVTVLHFIFKWLIPDIPTSLRKQINREDRMVNNLIIRHEQWRFRRTSLAHRRSRNKSIKDTYSAPTTINFQHNVNESKSTEKED